MQTELQPTESAGPDQSSQISSRPARAWPDGGMDSFLRLCPCVVMSQRPDFSLAFATPNIEELTGVSPADWASQPRRFWELVHEADAPQLRQQIALAAQTGAVVSNHYRIRHALTGRVAHLEENRRPVLDADGALAGYDVIWLDATRRTVAEQRLSAAAWKETLAVLTLGMAHDFRNIMAGIHSLSESFLAQVNAQDRFHEGLSLIKSNSQQATELIQRMISLHLGQAGERTYHDLNAVAADIAGFMAKVLKRRIKLGLQTAPESLPIYADIVELRQVVINLMLNAADAMPEGGNLTLRASRHTTQPRPGHFKGVMPRLPCVCLSIQDTGCGIKEQNLAAIFDPHFTTKPKGTGLGLYNALNAIAKHQGAISVESKEGAGTSFHIWLPQADFTESTRVEAAPNWRTRLSLLLLGRTGEVLDDTAEFLRSNNYQVVVATAPESLEGLLNSEDYEFAGVLVLAGPNDPTPGPFLSEARRQRAGLKVALKLAGRHQDDFDTHLLEKADLVLNPDLPASDTLAKLEALLKR